MIPKEFYYVVTCDKIARQTIAALWSATMKAGWTVLGDYDLSGLTPDDELASGVEVKALDVCQPEYAKPFVKADPMTALCMPCNVLVRCAHGKTTIASLKPSAMLPGLFPEAAGAVGTLPGEIDHELMAIIDRAASA